MEIGERALSNLADAARCTTGIDNISVGHGSLSFSIAIRYFCIFGRAASEPALPICEDSAQTEPATAEVSLRKGAHRRSLTCNPRCRGRTLDCSRRTATAMGMNMQPRHFTEEQELFRHSYRQFLQKEVLPHRKAWREAGIVPREMFRKMGDNNYLLMWADERFGGLGIEDFRFQQIVMEEDAFYGEPGFYHTLHSRLVAPYIKNFGTDAQQARFLP